MPQPSPTAAKPAGFAGVLATGRAVAFPLLLVTAILVIVAPMPPALLDLLLAGNVTIATVILLVSVYVSRPLDFSVFPAVLLGTTLARLVLNVASTRLILSRAGTDGTGAAGGVIEAFGRFVSGDNLVVGLILFGILVTIQFLVITKGATRIGEVAARFALDGMPGKQMAIDADLSAGLIDQDQAKRRRDEVTSQADFYGQMDGAGKFVRGDAVAGIVITGINIAGGLFVGIVQNGMDAATAGRVFTTLTIGDGLVSQVPAFLISLAAGLIVTRSSSATHLPTQIVEQLFRHHEAMFLASGFLVALSFTGLPAVPLLGLAGACGAIGFSLKTAKPQAKSAAGDDGARGEEKAGGPAPEPKPEDRLNVDALELELGVGLLKLADPAHGGDLIDRVTRVRHNVAGELGIILPKVRIRDNARLEPNDYRVKIRGVAVAKGQCHATGKLAVDTGAATGTPPGLPTTDPAFGRPAVWVDASAEERAALMGYHVVEPAAVVVTHLTEVVKDHAAELLTRQQVHALLDHLKERCPQLVEELVPEPLKAGQVHAVLANLLRERVPVRDLEAILEALSDYAGRTKDPTVLTEYARHALARTLCDRAADDAGTLHVVTLAPEAEDAIAAATEFTEAGFNVKLAPAARDAVVKALGGELAKLSAAGHAPAVLVSPNVRAGLRQVTATALPKLTILGLNEVTRDTEVESHGQVPADALRPAPVQPAHAPVPPPATPAPAFA